ESQGYKVEEDASATGKSGGEHSFDILARRDDGLTAYTIAVDIAVGDDE
ncbi:unnamed protein product, partial [marine sediment metagenome]